MLRISAFTHPSFPDLQERFLASLEMTMRESMMSPSHQSLIPAFKLQGSGFRVQGCSGGFAANMMGLRSKRIVIESEVEKSSLQTDE